MIEFDAEDLVSSKPHTVRITLAESVSVGLPSLLSQGISATVETLTESREYELTVTPSVALKGYARRGVILPLTPANGTSDLWPQALQVPYLVKPPVAAALSQAEKTQIPLLSANMD